jgi:hypothetical protein
MSSRELVKQSLKDIKMTTLKTASGKNLKNTDEIIDAIQLGELTAKEIGGIRKSLYNSTRTSSVVKDAIALDVARWVKKKHGELHTDADIVKLLTERGFTDTNRILEKYKRIIGKPWQIILKELEADKDIQMLLATKPSAKPKLDEWIKANVKTGTSLERSEIIGFIKDFGEKSSKASRFIKKYITPYIGKVTTNKVLIVIGLLIAIGAFTIKDTLLFACSRLGWDWTNKICGNKEEIEKADW